MIEKIYSAIYIFRDALEERERERTDRECLDDDEE